MPILQEKFQTTLKGKETGDEPWATAESARVVRNEPACNCLPVGYDASSPADKFRDGGYAGSTDVTDDVNIPNLRKGFTNKNMGMTDDLYTGEHCDHFYGDADGFVERNNYLDRM